MWKWTQQEAFDQNSVNTAVTVNLLKISTKQKKKKQANDCVLGGNF